MRARKLATSALCVLAFGALAACTSESAPSGGSSSTKVKSSTTTTAPHEASAWVQQWQPTLIGDYGAAQGAFLTAVNTRSPAAIRAAAAPLAAANATLRDAITKAGPPPSGDEASATLAMIALTTEAQLLQTIQTVCTGPTEACTTTLADYAKNQQKLILLFTDLGAAS